MLDCHRNSPYMYVYACVCINVWGNFEEISDWEAPIMGCFEHMVLVNSTYKNGVIALASLSIYMNTWSSQRREWPNYPQIFRCRIDVGRVRFPSSSPN